MNTKAVAIPYIITLVLGIGVLGLVGYWLFATGGRFGGEALSLECNNQKLIFCQGGGWKNECGDSSKIDCNQLFGISGGTTRQANPTFKDTGVTNPPSPQR